MINPYSNSELEAEDIDVTQLPAFIIEEYLNEVMNRGIQYQYQIKKEILSKYGYDSSIVTDIDYI